MTEAEWLTSNDPAAMLHILTGYGAADQPATGFRHVEAASLPRKLRLFACACARQVWDKLTDDAPCGQCSGGVINAMMQPCSNCRGTGRINRSRRAVEVAERYADGEADGAEFTAAQEALDQVFRWLGPMSTGSNWSVERQAWWVTRACFVSPENGAREVVRCREIIPPAAQAALLREIVGNPFRPVTLPKYFEEGDWVEAIPPHALACGSGVYPGAVVVSTNPFALVSDTGDMLWTATVSPDTVKRMGLAKHQDRAMQRWRHEKHAHEPLAASPVATTDLRTPTVLSLAQAAYEERLEQGCEKCHGNGKWKRCNGCGGEWAGDVGSDCFVCRHPYLTEKTCSTCHGTGRIEDGTLDPLRLSILADALEEAGCPTDAVDQFALGGIGPHPILNHLRSPGPHVRGCWAVDLVLGKE